MSFSRQDHAYMAQAMQLARRGLYTTDPNPNVGCIVVGADGKSVGEGWHARAGESHAEALALQAAGDQAKGATAYVTLEPCSHTGRTAPCADALIGAGISRLICAMQDPNPRVAGRGLEKLRAAGVEVRVGLLEAEARRLNAGFISRMERDRPWVRVKLAASMDGRTAMASGESKWITSAAARADVHRLRARSSALLTGIGTLLADDPQLNARCEDVAELKQPLRVVVDSRLRMPDTGNLFADGGGLHIYYADGSAEKIAQLEAAGAAVRRLAGIDGRVDLAAMLADLAKLGVNDVLVEAGPTLNGSLLAAGLIDEIIVYQAAKIMGSRARGMFDLETIESMDQSVQLEMTEARRVGSDLRLTYRTRV